MCSSRVWIFFVCLFFKSKETSENREISFRYRKVSLYVMNLKCLVFNKSTFCQSQWFPVQLVGLIVSSILVLLWGKSNREALIAHKCSSFWFPIKLNPFSTNLSTSVVLLGLCFKRKTRGLDQKRARRSRLFFFPFLFKEPLTLERLRIREKAQSPLISLDNGPKNTIHAINPCIFSSGIQIPSEHTPWVFSKRLNDVFLYWGEYQINFFPPCHFNDKITQQ